MSRKWCNVVDENHWHFPKTQMSGRHRDASGQQWTNDNGQMSFHFVVFCVTEAFCHSPLLEGWKYSAFNPVVMASLQTLWQAYICYGKPTYVMASLHTFRSKNGFNRSHNKWHGLTAKLVFNMIVEWLPHLYTPNRQLSVRSLSHTVNFKHRFNQRSGRFSNALQRRAPIGRWVEIKNK